MSTTILLADDHAILCEGVRRLVAGRADLRIVAQAGDGEEAVRLGLERRPDLAIVDLSLPRLSGCEAIRRLRRGAGTRCIVLSMHETRVHVAQAFEAGASGYVVKSGAWNELLPAIDAVRAGRSYLSPVVAGFAVAAIQRPGEAAAASPRKLTDREREVLRLVAEGLSSKEIAAALGRSIKTIETHRSHIMDKLEIRKSSKLVRVAIEEGLIAL
jgi:DNA-binding NarL/FixJ family response regulator